MKFRVQIFLHMMTVIVSLLTLPAVVGGGLIGHVCLSVCQQDYCKSNEPISLKLGVMIGPINGKN